MCLLTRILSRITKTFSSILWFVSSHYFPFSFLPPWSFRQLQKMHGMLYISLYKGHKWGLSYWTPQHHHHHRNKKTHNQKEGSKEYYEMIFPFYLATSLFKPPFVLQSRNTTPLLSLQQLPFSVKRSSAFLFPHCTAISLFLIYFSVQCYFFFPFGWKDGLSSHRLLLSCNDEFQLIFSLLLTQIFILFLRPFDAFQVRVMQILSCTQVRWPLWSVQHKNCDHADCTHCSFIMNIMYPPETHPTDLYPVYWTLKCSCGSLQ